MTPHLLKEQLRRIREDLSDKERLIYTLRIDQELSIREIAEIAAIPEGSVKSSLFYTLKKMASRLKVFTHEYYT
jgi:RNA polymerase sigma-70 factor (ECF subfamily)